MTRAKRRVLRAAILAAVVLLPLSGCGGPDAGTIYAKEHQPATATFMVFMVPMSCGTNCTMSIPVMYWVEDDEDWVVKIKDKKGDTADKYVSAGTFEAAHVGDWFDDKAPGSDDIVKLKRKPR